MLEALSEELGEALAFRKALRTLLEARMETLRTEPEPHNLMDRAQKIGRRSELLELYQKLFLKV